MMSMSRTSRILTAAAAVLLLSVFVFPLWSIHLVAPQYPEGIGMYIRVNTIVGWTEFDLDKINNLNHYVGMKRIVPEAIPELRYMPWLFAALIGAGVLVAISGRRRALRGWLVAFALLGASGLVDFYRWSYDYGHNLDPETAVIKVPGMSYQPPLIGSKQLLNFTATSWPGPAGWLAGVAFALGAIAAWRSATRRRHPATGQVVTQAAAAAVMLWSPDSVTRNAVRVTRQAPSGAPDTVVVAPSGPVRSVAQAIRLVRRGGHVLLKGGVYREPTLVIDRPLTIEGDGWPVLDGERQRPILTVTADDVTIRGLVLRDVGMSFVEDNAAIRVVKARRCTIERNRIENGFFAIYLAGVERCRVAGNIIRGTGRTEATSGNGIHLWSASEVVIEDNIVTGHRDGIYFEFVRNTLVRRNTSAGNLRYGLHFMYSDDCRYESNTFRRNQGGVAVMYTKHVAMVRNRFEDNWGSASYGLLLKEIADPHIADNQFSRNTVGLVADGATRIRATRNTFTRNGWAVKLLGSTYDGRFESNDFIGNTFDMAANGGTTNALSANYFDSYRGYDLDRDGFGDVPHYPVRLFTVLTERNAPTKILLRSFFADLLDAAERALPSLTPSSVVDQRPAMHRVAVNDQ